MVNSLRIWNVSLLLIVGVFSTLPAMLWLFGPGRSSGWTVGEWLIDYSDGFVRRGLFGSAINQIAASFDLEHLLVAKAAIALFHLIFVVSSSCLFLLAPRTPANVLVYGSPAFLLFAIDAEGALRKEILMLGLFASFLLLYRALPRHRLALSWIFAAVIPVLVLIHEGLFFFVPFLFAGLWLSARDGSNLKIARVQIAISGALVLTFFILSFFMKGSASTSTAICSRLSIEAQRTGVCDGAISYLGTDLEGALADVLEAANSPRFLPAYMLAVVLSSVPFLLVRHSTLSGKAWAICVIFSTPLFLVGVDWGRWIHVLFSLASLIILAFPQTMRSSRPSKRSLMHPSYAAFIALFVVAWNIPHARAEAIGPGVVGLVIRVLATGEI